MLALIRPWDVAGHGTLHGFGDAVGRLFGRLLTLDLVQGSEFWVWRGRCAVLARWPGTAA
jgi:hypothetical protein